MTTSNDSPLNRPVPPLRTPNLRPLNAPTISKAAPPQNIPPTEQSSLSQEEVSAIIDNPKNKFMSAATKHSRQAVLNEIFLKSAKNSEGRQAHVLVSLEGIELKRADLSGLLVRNVNFRGANFLGGSFDETVFHNCDLSEVSFKEGSFKRTVFIDCVLTGSEFSFANGHRVRFAYCHMCEADFMDSGFPFTDFRGTDLRGGNLERANISGSNFEGAFLAGVAVLPAQLEQCNGTPCWK